MERHVISQKDGTDSDYQIVLCHLPHNSVTPFATWRRYENGEDYWGHYFRAIEEAIQDYEERN